MTALVQAALTFQRGARGSFGYLAAGCLAVLVLGGFFRNRVGFGFEHILLGVVLATVLGIRLCAVLREQRDPARRRSWLELELGVLLLAAAHAVLQVFGGLQGGLYPLIYALMAFVGAFAERGVARLLVLVAIGFEAAVQFHTEALSDPKLFVLRASLLSLFGLLNPVLTQAEIGRVRLQNRRELRDEKARVQNDARLFRLAATGTASPVSDEERMTRSGVEEVHQALFFTLDLLRHTLGLHSAVLLMIDETSQRLRIVEWASSSDEIASGTSFSAATGAVGAVYQRGVTMNLEHLRPGYDGICYYQRPAGISAFMAVPVRDGGTVRGVLCADRRHDQPFSQQEEALLEHAALQQLRALENQRLFVQLSRSKREHAVLARVSQSLGAARTEREVFQAVLDAAAEIAPYDLAAVTRYDPDTEVHCVRWATGEGAGRLLNLRFRDNASLAAMTVKNHHYLPYRGEFDPGSQVVYTRKANLDGMQSLLILPLLVRDDAIGTLAFAARPREAFGEHLRPALSALASQLAVALSNVESVQRLEELATTDGLTGCFNKRYFNEHFQAKLSAAERFGRKLSLIITDIDHFKLVNDTYGHATGDTVIRELGAVLGRLKRQTDIVARFGGEEFCLLCEETDAAGATRLAERVRLELEATTFETEVGKLQVTCSLGVATYPDHARTLEALFEASDRALYKAKHAGRNLVCVG